MSGGPYPRLPGFRYRASSWDSGRSSDVTYQTAPVVLYCSSTPWFSSDSVYDVPPPVLLKTSEPPVLIVTVDDWTPIATIFAAHHVLSAGAVGSVSVNAPLVVSHG